MADVEETLADLTIEEEKEDVALPLDSKGSEGGVSYENCFVGSFFTTSVVHLQSMRSALANDCGGGHWSFNSHLLIMHRLKGGGDPMVVPLFTMDFWVLVHDLPHGFMSEMVAKQLSNFVGHFLEYDMKAISLGKKIVLANGRQAYVRFEYEKKNKTLNWGGASLYELQLGEWRRHRKADLVENNVIQNNTGWASSVGLHSRASAGPIGGLIQSHTTRLQHVDWDNDMCNVGDDRLILHMDGLKRHQALLSGAASHHETLKLERSGLGESSDCTSPSTCA
ncbi:hypothetical protein Gotri_022718 [Gossypium trilobum]|uniref:DUF4283 domain-containing protein n=1 Tax=Gossypium trilobum TaxID=34281 RepID=A0A7J9DGQ5_9ROSI|nr:hypothetical protein [Gossypium trilobum]